MDREGDGWLGQGRCRVSGSLVQGWAPKWSEAEIPQGEFGGREGSRCEAWTRGCWGGRLWRGAHA